MGRLDLAVAAAPQGTESEGPDDHGQQRQLHLDIDQLGWTGQDLQRPESVVAEPDGTLWASDGRGGVTRIDPDGGQTLLGGWGGSPPGWPSTRGQPGHANIGLGRVQRMTATARSRPCWRRSTVAPPAPTSSFPTAPGGCG